MIICLLAPAVSAPDLEASARVFLVSRDLMVSDAADAKPVSEDTETGLAAVIIAFGKGTVSEDSDAALAADADSLSHVSNAMNVNATSVIMNVNAMNAMNAAVRAGRFVPVFLLRYRAAAST